MVQTLSCSTRELLQHWTKSSRIPASTKRSVWRKWKLTKKTVFFFFEEDRLLTWSTNISGSLGPMILSRIMPIHLQSLFEMIIFRSSIQMGWNSIVGDTNPIWWRLGEFVQIRNTRVSETQDRFGSVQYWHSSEESRTWLSQKEDNGENKYRA